MKKIFVTILFLILFLASNQAFASKLPENEIKAFFENLFNIEIRNVHTFRIRLIARLQHLPIKIHFQKPHHQYWQKTTH